MKGQFRAVNRFITKISSVSSIDGVSNSGTFNVDDTTVGGFTLPQWAVTFYVTADFAQTGKEEIFRIVNVSGNTLTYDKRISVGGYTKPSHSAGASIRINDVADIINEMSDNIDNFGFVTQVTGTQTVKVWWGIFNNGWTIYNVSNTTLSITSGQLVDNSTNYIHFNLSTRLVSVEVSSTKAGAICFASVVVTGGIIGTITDLRPGLATTYGEISTKLDKTAGLRDWMGESFQTLEIDSATGNEVKKAVWVGTSISATETIRKRKADGTYEEITPSVLLAGAWLVITGSPVESWIVSGDAVWLMSDWLYKIQTEVLTSNNAGTSATTIWSIGKIDSTRYAICYNVGWTMYVVIATYTSATDVVTYWTPVIVGSAGTGLSGGMARIGASKLWFIYTDTSAATNHSVYLVVGTVSGTTVSMGGATTWSVWLWGTWTISVYDAIRIRDDAYAFTYYDQAWWGWVYWVTVSWTTVSQPSSIIWWYSNNRSVFLADNRIATTFPTFNVATHNVRILEINPASLVVTTTYTGSIGLTANNSATIARFSDTSCVVGWYGVINDANIYLFEKPWAGTTLVKNSVWTLSATGQKLIWIYDGIWWVDTWSSIIIMDVNQVIRTITWITTTETYGRPIYVNWRLIYNTWANLQSCIIRLARAMYVWVATDSVWWYKTRFSYAPWTWLVVWWVYFLQTNGTINRSSYTAWAVRIGRALTSSLLLLE